eukprot:CAMPEP_0117672050 /NCGR_PEP_ID=MMETSP0804-20121206/13685_1 /TAXON_ID=1074897 /ORGANISM="Tetraselmis astigmatica, Strain CCMP880" /LENGTH=177 /DNA_ID=CAMNT_0005480601 /DNA_START=643 /DNA_END=1176 /DNA_ORIENTATION=-
MGVSASPTEALVVQLGFDQSAFPKASTSPACTTAWAPTRQISDQDKPCSTAITGLASVMPLAKERKQHSMLSEALGGNKGAPTALASQVNSSGDDFPTTGTAGLHGTLIATDCSPLGGIFSRQPVPSFRSLCDDGVMPEVNSQHPDAWVPHAPTGSPVPSRRGTKAGCTRESTLQLA